MELEHVLRHRDHPRLIHSCSIQLATASLLQQPTLSYLVEIDVSTPRAKSPPVSRALHLCHRFLQHPYTNPSDTLTSSSDKPRAPQRPPTTLLLHATSTYTDHALALALHLSHAPQHLSSPTLTPSPLPALDRNILSQYTSTSIYIDNYNHTRRTGHIQTPIHTYTHTNIHRQQTI